MYIRNTNCIPPRLEEQSSSTYNIIDNILNSEHIEVRKKMMHFIDNNIITEDIDIMKLFLEDIKIIEEIDKILLPIKNSINNKIANIISVYIIYAILAKVLLANYKQGEKLLQNHYIAIRLRAHNILRKAQLKSLCNSI